MWQKGRRMHTRWRGKGTIYRLAIVLSVVLGACSPSAKNEGTELPKVMALSPALTEMLFATVPPDRIVARSQACNYPPAALEKPVVNTYPLNYEQLLRYKPDIVFTEAGISSTESIHRMREMGIRVELFSYDRVAQVPEAMRRIARLAHGDSSAAISLEKQLDSLERASAQVTKRYRALVMISDGPIYVHGRNTIMTDMLRLAGADNALPEVLPRPYPEITREYLLQLDPDVILGASFGRMDSTFFTQYPEMRQLRAYQQRAIYGLTADLATRPSPRIVQAIREIRTRVE